MSVYKTNIFKEGANSWLMHAVINSIPVKNTDAFFADLQKRSGEKGDPNLDTLEIELKVNGFDFDVKEFFVNLENQYQEMLNDQAKELIKTHCGDLSETMGVIKRAMLRTLEEKMGITITDEDRW